LNVDGTGKLKEDIILKNLQKSIEGKEMKSFYSQNILNVLML